MTKRQYDTAMSDTTNSSDNVPESDVIKKKQKEMSKGLQETYKEDMQGQSYELSKGAESEREKSTKRTRTGA
jgi:hypothetical protein